MTRIVCVLTGLVLLATSPALTFAADPAFDATVVPVLNAYCVSCHGGNKPKADLDLAALAPDFATKTETWKTVLDRLVVQRGFR